MRRSLAPWWVFPCAASFLAYFVLLVYCDVWRPVPEGLELVSAGDRPGMLVKDVTPRSPAAQAGLQAGDLILEADGHPVNSRIEWDGVQANISFDRPMLLDLTRGALVWRAQWVATPAGWTYWRRREGIDLLVTRLVQLITFALGLVVVFRRPFDVGARLGGWLLATFGVFCIALPYRIADVWRALPAPVGAALWVPLASSLALPALLLSFFLCFPRRDVRSPAAWVAIWLPAVVIVASHLRFLFAVIYRPDVSRFPADWFRWRWGGWIGYLGAAAVVAFLKYRRSDAADRRRLGVLLLGGGVGAVAGGPIALAFWRGSETTIFASPAVALAMLSLLIVPLSFAYAILRHRLFDVSFIIRQGVRYALARRLLISIVPVLLVALAADVYLHRDRSIGEQFGARAPVYLAVAAGAVIAQWQRQRWLDALDRRFFRERYDSQRLLRRVVEEVRRSHSVHQAAALVVEQVELALHPRFVTLLARLPGDETYQAVATAPATAGPVLLPGGAKLFALARVLGNPFDVSAAGTEWLSAHLPATEAAMVAALGLELIVPIDPGADRADAILALGARRSDEPYSSEDQELLWTIAQSLAVIEGRERTGRSMDEVFGECPRCGRCYDAGTSSCATESAALAVVHLPRVLSGRYRLEMRLGRGGMGVVYSAADLSLDRDVAVKVVREELVGDRESAERFESEARISARFTHPHVVTIHDFGVVSGSRAFLVMERLNGTTLREEIDRRGALDRARVLAIMRGVCGAVDAAHRRHLVHRDLKPDNVFLASNDGVECAKVLDFGIAKGLQGGQWRGRETTVGVILGTPQYMAPEQVRGDAPEPSWDIWALALMSYEMLTGFHPFATLALGLSSDGMPSAQPTIGRNGSPLMAGWQPFFSRWLSIESAGRPVNAHAFLAELEQMLEG